MPSGLLYNAVTGIDENDDKVGVGSARNHIPGVLDMSGCIGNNEFPFRGREIFIGNVYGNSLFAFCTQTISEQCQVNFPILFVPALFTDSFQLIDQNGFAVVQQSSDECAFTVVNTSRSYKS
jgi:hypothetical protein